MEWLLSARNGRLQKRVEGRSRQKRSYFWPFLHYIQTKAPKFSAKPGDGPEDGVACRLRETEDVEFFSRIPLHRRNSPGPRAKDPGADAGWELRFDKGIRQLFLSGSE